MKLLNKPVTWISQVSIEETYVKLKGKIYWKYRFSGRGKWHYQITPYKEVPYVLVKHNL